MFRQFSKQKIFYKSIGDITILYLKGEIMGLGVQGNYDDGFGYLKAGETRFQSGNDQEARQVAPVADPILAMKKDDEDKGLKVETNGPKVYATTERTITDKESREKAEYDVRVNYYRQRLDGDLNISDKEIKEAAERYVEDKKVQEDFENTELFMDKEKYKAAEKAREAERKKLIEQYRAEGLSKKEAKAKADAQLVENKYLKKGFRIFGVRLAGGRPRKAVEKMMADSQMQAKITDENGEFSSDKTKDVLLGVSNFNNGDSKHAREAFGASKQKMSHEEYNDYVERWSQKTGGDEETAKELLKEAGIQEPQADYVNQKTNHRISVNESEAASKKLEQDGVDISARQFRRLGKKANLSVEGDKAPYIKTGTGAVLAYAGHELIPPIVSKSGSDSSSASNALSNNAGANAGAEASGYGAAGASAKVRPGGLAGTLGFFFGGAREKDHVIPELKDYNKKPQTQEQQEQIQQQQEQQQQEQIQQQEQQQTNCETTYKAESVCIDTVQKGSSWAYYAENSGITINGKKPAGKMEEAYLYAQQLMYGIENPRGLKETRFLTPGKEYVQHTDFSKLFENQEIMAKYPQIRLLQGATIDTTNCKDLTGDVKGRKNPGFKYGGNVTNPTTISLTEIDCHGNTKVTHIPYEK